MSQEESFAEPNREALIGDIDLNSSLKTPAYLDPAEDPGLKNQQYSPTKNPGVSELPSDEDLSQLDEALQPQKLIKDPVPPSVALSQEEPRNSLMAGIFSDGNNVSLQMQECVVVTMREPHLKLKYIPSGKKQRVNPSEMVQLGNGLMKLSFRPVTIKRQLWEGLDYVQIKLKETPVLSFSNKTRGKLSIDASDHAFRNKTVRCFFVQQIKNTFKNSYRGCIEVSARLRVDPDAAQTIILEIIIGQLYPDYLPQRVEVEALFAPAWQDDPSVTFEGDVRRQFSFHLNSTVYKKYPETLGIYIRVSDLEAGRLKNVGHIKIIYPKSKEFLKKLQNFNEWTKETFPVWIIPDKKFQDC